MNKKQWEEQLIEKWYLYHYNDELKNFTTCGEEIKQFISTLLKEKDKEFSKILDEMEGEEEKNIFYDVNGDDYEIEHNRGKNMKRQEIINIRKKHSC